MVDLTGTTWIRGDGLFIRVIADLDAETGISPFRRVRVRVFRDLESGSYGRPMSVSVATLERECERVEVEEAGDA